METLEQRIATRLNEALDRQVAAEVNAWEVRGLATREPAEDPVMRLSVEDVARIAAQTAYAWF